ncbi:MAG: hypothetical protein AAF385_17760 [Pseudomonadota bacterium]
MLGQRIGITNEEMAALGEWESSDNFDAKDKLTLRLTDALCQSNNVEDELYAALEAEFAQPEIMKLAFTIGLAGMVNRVHATFRTTVDRPTLEGAVDTPFCALNQS